jgi:hypothetical protein
MTQREKEEGARLLNRVCLHYAQNLDLYDKQARLELVKAMARLICEPIEAPKPFNCVNVVTRL